MDNRALDKKKAIIYMIVELRINVKSPMIKFRLHILKALKHFLFKPDTCKEVWLFNLHHLQSEM